MRLDRESAKAKRREARLRRDVERLPIEHDAHERADCLKCTLPFFTFRLVDGICPQCRGAYGQSYEIRSGK